MRVKDLQTYESLIFQKDSLGRREAGQTDLHPQLPSLYYTAVSILPG